MAAVGTCGYAAPCIKATGRPANPTTARIAAPTAGPPRHPTAGPTSAEPSLRRLRRLTDGPRSRCKAARLRRPAPDIPGQKKARLSLMAPPARITSRPGARRRRSRTNSDVGRPQGQLRRTCTHPPTHTTNCERPSRRVGQQQPAPRQHGRSDNENIHRLVLDTHRLVFDPAGAQAPICSQSTPARKPATRPLHL